jgi:hypothetical protein
VPDPGTEDVEPEHLHAVPATPATDEEGNPVTDWDGNPVWDWMQIEDPDLAEEWQIYEAWWPRSYSLN